MATRLYPPGLRAMIGAALNWLRSPAGLRLAAAVGLIVLAQAAFAGYESVALGLAVVREEPPGLAPYQLVQTLAALGLAGLLVAAVAKARPAPNIVGGEPLRRTGLVAGIAANLAAAAALALFLIDPAAFHAAAQEDRPLEWLSALLLLAAAVTIGLHAVRRAGGLAGIVLAGGLGLVLMVIGMEEISWGQRIFGFATPDRLAEMNWQSEFNLHNVQTDLSETLYYVGAVGFLLVLPLLRELLPSRLAAQPVAALLPGRDVALVSAPLAWFNYGHWDLFSIQLGAFLALLALLAWSRAARSRGCAAEANVFLFAAAVALIGQALLLAGGPAMVDLPDSTEYKELFIALGFAFHAWRVAAFAAKPASP